MEFIDELKKNSICSAILEDIADESWQDVQIKFSVHEVNALTRVAYFVYKSFCSGLDDDGLSLEINHFLDNLNSAYEKLDNSY